jgi:energy-converting hydrogenase B subunit I
MSKVVRTITRLITPAVLIFGLYVIMHGHVTSGGGFQGGAVFASAAALLLVAFGSERVKHDLKIPDLTAISVSGAVLFIGLGFAGIATTFFYNLFVGSPLFGHVPTFGPAHEDIWTGGVIPLMNIGVALNVVAGLAAVMVVMAITSGKKRDGE